jgi:hypothetical protein
MLLRICGERRADSFDGELNFLQIFRKNARDNRIDRHLTLWPSANDIAGARRVPAPSRPDSISMEANAAKTSFLQAVRRPAYRDPRRAGRKMLWREHAFQGRCQPGRRAVLEETSCEYDQHNSTLCAVILQAWM